ncbi:MAG: transcription elongation factor GreA [Treponema sp.]|nr:transcription elongation factor GreA [Treponema sp.]
MVEKILTSVQEMLNEEKWTRAAISNYSKNQFLELSDLIETICNENCIDEAKQICNEHLAHTKNSIIGLYLSGILSLKKRELDNSALVTLINIFQDNHKSQIVEYLCESILEEDSANKFALRTLADCYREENNTKIWDIYEEIVRLDFDEADIAKTIAEYNEKEGNSEKAIDYYKKALLRFVNNKSMNQIKEIWSKLVIAIPEEKDFFYLVQRKIAKTISEEKSALLMQELYIYYKDNQKWDTAIEILKLILSIDEKDNWARKEIVDCFRGKYADHSQLEEHIRISNLNQSWRNIFEAISDFEKHIAFDKKNFVFHRTWGVGIIRNVKGDELVINFGKRFGVREMSLKMAVSSLQPLEKNHIWVLKATKTKEVLVKKVKDDIAWALKTIIKSFNDKCDFKTIKAELVPAILTTGEWTSWSTKARRVLETNATFGVDPDDITLFTVRDNAITTEEKLSNEFNAQKDFFKRIDILMKFAADANTESEHFADMFSYFSNYLRAASTANEQTIASFLVYRNIITRFPHIDSGINLTFSQLFEDIENLSEMYLLLKDTKNTSLRKDFMDNIKTLLPNWADIFVEMFPTVLNAYDIIGILLENGHDDKVKQLAVNSFENYRDNRNATIYFFEECQDKEWFKEINIPYEKQLISLIHIMEINYREIANHKNTTENRKINRKIHTLLFKNETLLNYMLSNDTDTITRLYTLIDDIKDLDVSEKAKMRNKILEKDPDFKFFGVEEKSEAPKGLVVTIKMLEEKKRQLEQITTVDIPQNSKDIGEAMAFGDLSENAEYHAAKERQAQLNILATRLQDELNRAQVFDPTTITTARISFGTTVTLQNLNTNKAEKYTILGPWESDPDNGIISYMSPFGIAIMNAKEDEELNFEINDVKHSYKVEKIKAVKF